MITSVGWLNKKDYHHEDTKFLLSSRLRGELKQSYINTVKLSVQLE